jgi:uncharacterized membrane protein
LEENTTVNYSITYHVPENETSSQEQIIVIAKDFANREWSTSFFVHIHQPHITITTPDPGKVDPGQTYLYNITLTNDGDDNATNVVMSHDCPQSWICSFNETSFPLLQSHSKNITFSVSIPSNETNSDVYVHIRADYDGLYSTSTMHFQVKQPNVYWTTNSSQHVKYGVIRYFLANLTNDGEASVSLNLSYNCPESWTCTINESSVVLSPGETKTYNCSIFVPSSYQSTSANTYLVAYNDVRNYQKTVNVVIQAAYGWSVDDQHANITQTISFNATLSSSSGDDAFITAGISCPDLWICSLNETSFLLPSFSSKTLAVNITVPFEETENQRSPVLWAYDGYRNITKSFIVYVTQPNITSNFSSRELDYGVNYILANVSNNGPINLSLYAQMICPDYWDCYVEDEYLHNFALNAHNSSLLNISIHVPDEETNPRVNLTLHITDTIRDYDNTQTFFLSVPHLVILLPNATIKRCETASINATITNDGYANATNISLSVLCPGIECSVQDKIDVLEPNESTNVTISLSMPCNPPVKTNLTLKAQFDHHGIKQYLNRSEVDAITPILSISQPNEVWVKVGTTKLIPIVVKNNGTDDAINTTTFLTKPPALNASLSIAQNITLSQNQNISGNITLSPDVDGDYWITTTSKEKFNVSSSSNMLVHVYLPAPLQDVQLIPVKEVIFDDSFNALSSIDWNGDGNVDVIASKNNTLILLSNNGSSFINSTLHTFNSPICGIATGNISNKISIAIVLSNGSVYLLYNDSNTPQHIADVEHNGTRCGIAFVDANNDTKTDLAIGTSKNEIDILLNDGNSFLLYENVVSIYEPFSITSGDYDEDGLTDLFVGDKNGQVLFVKNTYNNSGVNFTIKDVFMNKHSNAPIYGICSADYELKDQFYLDVLFVDGGHELELLRNKISSFNDIVLSSFNSLPYALTCADYDVDGDVDLVVSSEDKTYLLTSKVIVNKKVLPLGTKSRKVEIVVKNPFFATLRNLTVVDMWKNGDINIIENTSRYKDVDGIWHCIPDPYFNGTHVIFWNFTEVDCHHRDEVIGYSRYYNLSKNENITIEYQFTFPGESFALLSPGVAYWRRLENTSGTNLMLSDDVENYQVRSPHPSNFVIVNNTVNAYDEGGKGLLKPDFVIEDVSIIDDTLRYYGCGCEVCSLDSIYSLGKAYKIKVDVKNLGTDSSTDVGIYINGTLLGTCTTELIPTNSSKSCYVWWIPDNESIYNITAMADPNDFIEEYNETNNQFSFLQEISTYVDLYFENISVIDGFGNAVNNTYENTRYNISITIGNNGTRTAKHVFIRLYLCSNSTCTRTWHSTCSNQYIEPHFSPYYVLRDINIPPHSSKSYNISFTTPSFESYPSYNITVSFDTYESYPRDINMDNNNNLSIKIENHLLPPDLSVGNCRVAHCIKYFPDSSGGGSCSGHNYVLVNYSYKINITSINITNFGGQTSNQTTLHIQFGYLNASGDFINTSPEYSLSVPQIDAHSSKEIPINLFYDFDPIVLYILSNPSECPCSAVIRYYLEPVQDEVNLDNQLAFDKLELFNFHVSSISAPYYIFQNTNISVDSGWNGGGRNEEAKICHGLSICNHPYVFPSPIINSTMCLEGYECKEHNVSAYDGEDSFIFHIPSSAQSPITFCMYLDGNNRIIESDESDNSRCVKFPLAPSITGGGITTNELYSTMLNTISFYFNVSENTTNLKIQGIKIELFNETSKITSLLYLGKDVLNTYAQSSHVVQNPTIFLPSLPPGQYTLRITIEQMYDIQPLYNGSSYILYLPEKSPRYVELPEHIPVEVDGERIVWSEKWIHRGDVYLNKTKHIVNINKAFRVIVPYVLEKNISVVNAGDEVEITQ